MFPVEEGRRGGRRRGVEFDLECSNVPLLPGKWRTQTIQGGPVPFCYRIPGLSEFWDLNGLRFNFDSAAYRSFSVLLSLGTKSKQIVPWSSAD